MRLQPLQTATNMLAELKPINPLTPKLRVEVALSQLAMSELMQVYWQEWDRRSRIGCGSPWYPAWRIAEVGRDPTK